MRPARAAANASAAASRLPASSVRAVSAAEQPRATQRAPVRVKVTVQLDSARRAGFLWRCIGQIPSGYEPAEALQRLASAVGAELRSIGDACDSEAHQGKPRVLSKRTGEAHQVEVPLYLPPAMDSALRERLVNGCHLALPAPWGGLVAAFTNGPSERRLLRLVDVPMELRLETLEAALKAAKITPTGLTYDTDPFTKLTRIDVATCTVPAAAKLPDILDIQVGASTYAVKLRPVSAVPQAPQWAPRQQPAASAAGAAAATATPLRQPVSYAAALARAPPGAGSGSRPPLSDRPPPVHNAQATPAAGAALDQPPPAGAPPARQHSHGNATAAAPTGQQVLAGKAASGTDSGATTSTDGDASHQRRSGGHPRSSNQRSPSPPPQHGATGSNPKKHAGPEAFAHAAGVTEMDDDTVQPATTAGGPSAHGGPNSGC